MRASGRKRIASASATWHAFATVNAVSVMIAAEVEVDGTAGTPTAVRHAETRDRRLQDDVTVTTFTEQLHPEAPTPTSHLRAEDAEMTGAHHAAVRHPAAVRRLALDRHRGADAATLPHVLARRHHAERAVLATTAQCRVTAERKPVTKDAEIALLMLDVAHDHLDVTDAAVHQRAPMTANHRHPSAADQHLIRAHARRHVGCPVGTDFQAQDHVHAVRRHILRNAHLSRPVI